MRERFQLLYTRLKAEVTLIRARWQQADKAAQEASEQELPSHARELIGKDPDIVEVFDLEATIEGRYVDEELSRLGLAFE